MRTIQWLSLGGAVPASSSFHLAPLQGLSSKVWPSSVTATCALAPDRDHCQALTSTNTPESPLPDEKIDFTSVSRREMVSLCLAAAATTEFAGSCWPAAIAAEVEESPTSASDKKDETADYVRGPDEFGVLFGDGPIGLKLGDNPLKATGVCRVFVTQVVFGSQAVRQPSLRPGLGIAAVAGRPAASLSPQEVAGLIRTSPRPLEITFRDPDLLRVRLQSAADEAKKEKKLAKDSSSVPDSQRQPATETGETGARGGGGGMKELRVTKVNQPRVCGTKTRAGDFIEIRYTARLASDMSREFDSSDRRGTGLPYAITLGSGDVVKGLDLALFDMCIGERRKVEVPARLAYGLKGSKVFGVPPDDGTSSPSSGDVVYGVELVSINFRSDPAGARDNFYTDAPCDREAFAAGNASGLCRDGFETQYMEQDQGPGSRGG